MEDFGVTTSEQHPAPSQLEMTTTHRGTINYFKKTMQLNSLALMLRLAA